MPSTKPVAILTLGLFLLQIVAGAATAQQAPTDLVVTRVTVDNARVGVPSLVTVIVENKGGSFNQPLGWQVFVGWNGTADANCIQSPGIESGTTAQGSVCYQRVSPNNSSTSLDRGETATFNFLWTPRTDQVEGRITTIIETATTVQGSGQTPSSSNAPDSVFANNMDNWTMRVANPVVRANPIRDAPASGKVNDPWQFNEIVKECEPNPAKNSTSGCRAKPGSFVYFTYNVTNLGNVYDNFRGSVYEPAGEDNLTNRGYKFFLAPNPIGIDYIPGSNTQIVRLTVFVPENETAHQGINLNGTIANARITWRSSVNPNVDTSDTDACPSSSDAYRNGICTDPSLPTIVAGIKHGLNATSNETYRALRVSEEGLFNITLNNSGNADDTYRVMFLRDNWTIGQSWQPSGETNITLARGEIRNVTMRATPPPEALRSRYNFSVLVRSIYATGTETDRLLFFQTDVLQKHGVDAGAPSVVAQVAPAQKAAYVVNVRNTGNGLDNVTIDFNNPQGWPLEISTRRLALAPGEVQPVYLNVTPPAGIAADSESFVFVNVTSEGPLEKPASERAKAPLVTLLTQVKKSPNLRLTQSEKESYVDRGANKTYDVTLVNTGNLISDFTVRARPDNTEWVTTTTPAGEITLAPQEAKTVTVRVTAPGGAEVGERAKIFTEVVSEVDAGIAETVTYDAKISGPDLVVTSIIPNLTTPYMGDVMGIDVTVRNVGNKAPDRPVNVTLLFRQDLDTSLTERVYSPSELGPNQQRSFTVTWDTNDKEGSGLLVASIDPANQVKEIDEAEASNVATRVVFLRTSTLTISTAEGLSGRPGETLRYDEGAHVFKVRHEGNLAREEVLVTVESEHGWVRAEDRSQPITLLRDADTPVLVRLDIPAMPGAALDRLTITVEPTARPGVKLSASTTTRVLDDEKPVIDAISLSKDSITLGESLTISARILDATGVTVARAFVVTPTNETTTLLMARESADVWSLTQPFTLAGQYRVFVEAVDGSENGNLNNSRTLAASFSVTPGSAPVIKLADGQATTIRTGGTLKLSVTDPLGIGKVSYTLKGISYELRPPYEVQTTSFSAGQVQLNVTAENLYGVKTTQTLTVTVDNAAPDVKRVVITPESPKANEDLTVTVETDTDVQAVDVLLKKNGQVVETRSATRKAAGTFELLLNPAEGDYAIDVTAKDAAGNAKLQEGAVVFSARPASPFDIPAPGIPLLALALVGVALLWRRRN